MKPMHKLQRLFTKTKTHVKQRKYSFCYKIKCNGETGNNSNNQQQTCQKSYIGETGRADGDKENLPLRIKPVYATSNKYMYSNKRQLVDMYKRMR